MRIESIVARIVVDDLDAAVAVYERLTATRALRFRQAGVDVAAVGGRFLLLSGPEDKLARLRRVAATVVVADVDEAAADLAAVDAEIIVGPQDTPAGRNLVARHPDGSVFEYVCRHDAPGPDAPAPR